MDRRVLHALVRNWILGARVSSVYSEMCLKAWVLDIMRLCRVFISLFFESRELTRVSNLTLPNSVTGPVFGY